MREMGRCDGSWYALSDDAGNVDECGDEISMVLRWFSRMEGCEVLGSEVMLVGYWVYACEFECMVGTANGEGGV
jgi:hypothetical protein